MNIVAIVVLCIALVGAAGALLWLRFGGSDAARNADHAGELAFAVRGQWTRPQAPVD